MILNVNMFYSQFLKASDANRYSHGLREIRTISQQSDSSDRSKEKMNSMLTITKNKSRKVASQKSRSAERSNTIDSDNSGKFKSLKSMINVYVSRTLLCLLATHLCILLNLRNTTNDFNLKYTHPKLIF